MESWLLLEQGKGAPAWNMACDQWLLQNASRWRVPVLRIYGWDRPGVSIGYFQIYPENLAKKYSIIRRPTGGGLVFHGSDLTYTVALPTDHPWKKLGTVERYAQVHERVARVFERRGLRTEMEEKKLADSDLSPKASTVGEALAKGKHRFRFLGSKVSPSICFEKNSRYDVLVEGRKVAGGAQRVTRSGLIHQGSIRMEKGVSAEELKEAWESFETRFEKMEMNPRQGGEIEELVERQFGTEEWNLYRGQGTGNREQFASGRSLTYCSFSTTC